MNNQIKEIKDYLEKAYMGAKAMRNIEDETRIARALAALQGNPEMEIFTDEFKEAFVEMQILS